MLEVHLVVWVSEAQDELEVLQGQLAYCILDDLSDTMTEQFYSFLILPTMLLVSLVLVVLVENDEMVPQDLMALLVMEQQEELGDQLQLVVLEVLPMVVDLSDGIIQRE